MGVIGEIRERFGPFKLHLAALAGALMLGVGVGVFKTATTPPHVREGDRWTLPRWTPYQAGPARRELAGTTIFIMDPAKRAAAVAADEASATAWRFTGTVREGSRQIALIEVDKGEHVRRIVPGDKLPDGGKVTSIRVGELTYTTNAGEQTLKLFTGTEKPLSLATSRH